MRRKCDGEDFWIRVRGAERGDVNWTELAQNKLHY